MFSKWFFKIYFAFKFLYKYFNNLFVIELKTYPIVI